jgi:transcriptional regulator with XRE-family HTH domain
MIASRVRRERLNQNRTQEEIALTAGVALNVVKRLESGLGCSLRSLVRLLRALGKLEQLDLFLPEPGVSPMQLAAFEGRERKEATGRRGRGRRTA